MYELFGLNRMLQFFAVLVLITVLLIWLTFGGGEGASGFLRYIFPAVGTGLALVWILGDTVVFPFVCRLPMVNKVVPDIDGQWIGYIHSNWPIVEDRAANPRPEPQAIEIEVAIKARWTYVHMTIASTYLRSETLALRPVRHARSGQLELLYIFESVLPNPGASDGDVHLGAARLQLLGDGQTPRFEGVYWTNRNWRQGHNTAGRVELRRKAS